MNKLLAILALGALVAPIAMAHPGEEDAGAGGFYVGAGSVWQEANTESGLQSAVVLCHDSHVEINDNGTPDDTSDDFEEVICDADMPSDDNLLA
ncbi:MAG: hypothetical protein HY556_02755 [Euryarchaeota archaeon]|nr:hypothetical protein [Euryarchaeota archaeon]